MFSFVSSVHKQLARHHKESLVRMARMYNNKAVLWAVRGNNAMAQLERTNRNHYMQLAREV